MKATSENETLEEVGFANRAAKSFAKNKEMGSFGNIGEGEFLALRWGLGDDCVLVLKQDPDFVPTNYRQLVSKYKEEP